jgi:adenylylsulfate kinase-like enzyme
MIIVLFGQPCSGKTTISKRINHWLRSQPGKCRIHFMDGDSFRRIFTNKDYSRDGRMRNLNLASHIAHYEHSLNDVVLMSFIYPYKESRSFLDDLTDHDIMWVHLHYDTENDQRGRENFHVTDFDIPETHEIDVSIDTTLKSEDECFEEIKNTFMTKYRKFYNQLQ